VRRNIIGFANFDSDLYEQVVHSCALEEDIALFPDEDQTIIGSKGITLSGGQKQRVVGAVTPDISGVFLMA
jgi:ABC-type bacteriocin/lantibiotic exporter with double-glycine peptidase domain